MSNLVRAKQEKGLRSRAPRRTRNKFSLERWIGEIVRSLDTFVQWRMWERRRGCFRARVRILDDPIWRSSSVSILDIRGCRIWRHLSTCLDVLRIRSRRSTLTSRDCLFLLPYHSSDNSKHNSSLLWPIEATRDRSCKQHCRRTLLASSCILFHYCTFPSHPIDNSPTPTPTAISKTIQES